MTEKKVELGTEEAVRYDRQMRLWGVEAQLSMMGSRVVLLGVDCLGSEVAKNIVLGGVGALHIVDESAVQESDFGKNFLITDPASLGAPRAKACLAELSAMNSLVRLTTSTELSFESASCVIITDRSKSETLAIMKECRKVNTPCIACMSFGMLSMCLSDFGDAFVTTLQEGGAKREHTASFPDAAGVFAGAAPLKGAAKVLKSCVACLALWEAGCTVADSIDAAHTKIAAAAQRTAETLGVKSLDDTYIAELANHAVGSFSPVCCVAGGMYSQEVLKVVQRSGRPMVNTFVYDALEESKGYCECLTV